MFYDDIDLKFFYVDRENHDEICKQYGLNFEESYMLFTELWGFAGYWIYDEESFLKKLDVYRRINNYLKERDYDLDGVRIEYESEPFRFRQADHLDRHGIAL